jgi:hypothetical protein
MVLERKHEEVKRQNKKINGELKFLCSISGSICLNEDLNTDATLKRF